MKNKVTILTTVVLLGASLLMTGCPRHLHSHFPRPHHLQQGDLHLAPLLQNERQASGARISIPLYG